MEATEKKKIGIVVGAGEFTDRGIREPGVLLAAADGGYERIRALGLTPDLVIGDFDSLGYIPKEAKPVILPTEKDDTDMAAACEALWQKGCRDLRIYGGSGSRPDHFLANLQLAAAFSRRGADVRLVLPACTVFLLTDGTLEFSAEPGTTFSVFSHRDRAEGVSIRGDVRYPLWEAVLSNETALGVSNQMTGETARVDVRSGTLLVFLYEGSDAAE